ncbi:MAG TPA: T9SS type A sorting domain-containing protein [Candidatus Eisenbacteria bacterium]
MGSLVMIASMRMAAGAIRRTVLGLMIGGVVLHAAPASAQWSRVAEIPAARVPSVWANGDTIAAGVDTVVYVSTNAGATWRRSAKPATGVTSIQAVQVLNGRLYAGTSKQGVQVSDDLGSTWSSFNQGLVGGFEDSQLDVSDLLVRGDTMLASTQGAGVYARNLAGSGGWQPFGGAFELNQASNVDGLALGGSRVLALAGSNGQVFRNDPGEPDWTTSNLDNVGVHAGLHAETATWTGTVWIVGTNLGLFRSSAGQEPWARFNPGLGVLIWTALASQDGRLFVVFDLPNSAVVAESGDDGATWQNVETQPNVFVQKLAISGGALYAARADGLWRRPLAVTSVETDGRTGTLQFAVAGPQPFGSRTSLRFDLPRAAQATIELFDIQGRLVGERIEGSWSAGRHEVPLDAQRLASGVYFARLTAGGKHQVVRLVHLR